jgi:hypothetical protein
MNFIGRIMRFLFWLLIVSWSVALLRRAMAWMLREGGELVHFCSAACRDKYVNDTQRLAANG